MKHTLVWVVALLGIGFYAGLVIYGIRLLRYLKRREQTLMERTEHEEN